jgi:hypothetical protein
MNKRAVSNKALVKAVHDYLLNSQNIESFCYIENKEPDKMIISLGNSKEYEAMSKELSK